MSSEEINNTPPDKDKKIQKIGEGGFGKVYKVEHEGKILARKEVKYRNEEESKTDDAMHEIDLLKGLNHKNIVKLVDSYIDTYKNIIYIYTVYYNNGNLWRIIDEKRKNKEYFSLLVYFFVYILIYRRYTAI